MNLDYHYPSIYWACACLMVKSNSIDRDYAQGMDIEDKEKQNDAGKTASALGQLQNNGFDIAPPDINRAEVGFIPDAEGNLIVMGFKPISGLNNETAKLIIENRPYSSLQDFHERLVETKREVTSSTGRVQNKSLVSSTALINLIKAGAFDSLENKSRREIMYDYLHLIKPDKTSLTTRDIDKIEAYGLFPPELDYEVNIHNYVQAVKDCKTVPDEQVKSTKWAILADNDIEYEESLIQFFEQQFMGDLQENKDYRYNSEGQLEIALCSRKTSFLGVYKLKTKALQDYLTTEECLKQYNEYLFKEFVKSKADGSEADWNFESSGYYNRLYGHALKGVDLKNYNIVDFNDLPEEPAVDKWYENKHGRFPIFKISRIAGTVISKNTNKNYITILTTDGEVVNVKLQKGQAAHYNQTLSLGNGKEKVTIEKSWFERGSKLCVNGYRKGSDFVAKTYANGTYGKHVLLRITEVNSEDKTIVLQTERANLAEY